MTPIRLAKEIKEILECGGKNTTLKIFWLADRLRKQGKLWR